MLKDENAIREYWLEPGSRRVEPERLLLCDYKRRVIEKIPYSPDAGAEIRASVGRRLGVIIDFGKEVGGYPHLVFGAGRCRRVGVQAAESLEHFHSRVIAEAASVTDPAFYHEKAKGKPSSQVDLPHCGGFRYIWVYPECPGRVTLRDVWLDYTPHLVDGIDSCGYFLSSDDTLNRAWFAGLHTLEMCTIDPALGGVDGKSRIGEGEWVLVDGAKRDRLIWAGDIAPMAVATYSSSGNNAAVRSSLMSLAAYQEKNGYIPACSPGPLPGRIASPFFGDYVAWWVVALYQYYLHTGDLETVGEQFQAVKRALHYLHSQCRGGLYRQTPLNMMEWCFTVLRTGKPAYTNVMYYWALNSASFLAHELDDQEVSVGYVSRAFRLSEAIERELWDESSGVFVDTTTDRRRVPQDANSLAIVSGLVSEPAATARMLDYLAERTWSEWGSNNVDRPYYHLGGLLPHSRRVIPFMNNYEALGRFIAGDRDRALELVRRCWGNMLERGPGSTFWEWAGADGEVPGRFTSLCHGWSSGVVPLLSKFVLGLRPKGHARTYKCDPNLLGLDWVEGRVPVDGGFIAARAERTRSGDKRVKVEAPNGWRQR